MKNNNIQGMKMVIYRKTEDPKRPVALRSVTVGPDFEGINEYGQPINKEFHALASALEPSMDYFTVMTL